VITCVVDCHYFLEKTLELRQNNKPGKYCSLEVHFELVKTQTESNKGNRGTGQSGDQRVHMVTVNSQPAAVFADAVKLTQEDEVGVVLGQADHGVASLSNFKGMSTIEGITGAIDTAGTLTDSDGFALVCGYVEKLMGIGDIVSGVRMPTTNFQNLDFNSILKTSSQVHPWRALRGVY
jgi:hypothetical protein